MAHHLHIEAIECHIGLKAQRFCDFDFSIHSEWDVGDGRRLHIQLLDFTGRPNHHMFIVGHPVKVGVHAKNGPRLLLVFVELIVHGPLLACFKVAEVEHRFFTHTLYKREGFAVARDLRTRRATGSARYAFNLSLFKVVAKNDIDLRVGIFVVLEETTRIHVFTEVEVLSIGRHAGFIHVLLIVFAFGELHP